ncbi:MAG: PAS domain S-box protein [Desulfuromonadales bacterium]
MAILLRNTNSRRLVNSDDLDTVIATSMDGFLLVDMDGNILSVNESYCQLVGYTHEQLLSMHVSSVDAVDDHADVAKRVEKIVQMGSLRFETKHRHKNGNIIDIEASSNYSPAHGGSIFSFIRDISYQKRNRQIIAARLKLIEYSHSHSLRELLRETLDEAEILTGSRIGFYHFMDSDSQMLTLQAWSTRTAAEFCKTEGSGSHYPIAQAGVWVDCVHERRPVIHNDYASLPHRKGMPEGHAAVVRELVVPIFRDGNIVAILGVGNKLTDYDRQDIEVITILADLAWEVAERKKAEDALKKSEAILNSSQHLAKVGGWKWDIALQSMTWTEETYRIHDFEPGTIRPGSSDHIEKSLNCYDPEDRQSVRDAFQRCVEHGEEYDLELPFTTAAGRRLWIRTTAKPVWHEELVAKVIGNIMDITESRLAEDALQKAHKQLEQMSSAVPGVVYQFLTMPTGEWSFVYVSKGLKDLYEIEPDEALRDHNIVTSCIVPEDRISHRESVASASRSLSIWVHEHRILTPGGKFKWVRGQAIPQRNEDGSVLWNGILIDITDRKQMEEELLLSKAAADSANRAKSEFLANMSHEIRNPMNGVIGTTQLLEMTELNEDQREYVAALKLSGKNLLTLINDILDLSKIEAGKITFESAEFSLQHCINDVALMQKTVIYEKRLKLDVEVSDDIPPFMMGDQHRIKQILHNLMGNAVKFTSQGGITISAQLLDQQDSSLLVELAVRDSGIGISPENLDKIFRPFEQEDGSTTRNYGGTGLGLTISRRLAELMGGGITVESSPNAGSCFKVTLPLAAVNKSFTIEEAPPKAGVSWDGCPLRILLVEDDQVSITLESSLFRKLGFDVIVTKSGRECLAALENDRFDIVLMDINMPDMNGEDALCKIRRNEQDTHRHQMIIALTAYSLRGDRERFLDEGFDGYVSKPMAISELVREMKRVLGVEMVKGTENRE